MKLEGEQTLLRVFLKNTDKASWWTSAQDALFQRALARKLAGAMSLQGACGVVAGHLVECGRWTIVEHHPVILEFLDSSSAIGSFLADVAQVVPRALATVEPAHVLAYRKRAADAAWLAPHLKSQGQTVSPALLPGPEEFNAMRTAVDGQLLRIFVDDTDTFQDQPLYKAILAKTCELGLSNAVVLRAPKGFGTHRRLHSDSSPDYAAELPLVIEVVGTTEEIGRLLPFLDEAVPEGLITLEGVTMLLPRKQD
jgi:uncharacterized protein